MFTLDFTIFVASLLLYPHVAIPINPATPPMNRDIESVTKTLTKIKAATITNKVDRTFDIIYSSFNNPSVVMLNKSLTQTNHNFDTRIIITSFSL